MSQIDRPPERVGETEPSRPGIKFALCVVAAIIVIAIIVLRS